MRYLAACSVQRRRVFVCFVATRHNTELPFHGARMKFTNEGSALSVRVPNEH